METLYPIFNNEIFNCTTPTTINGDDEKEGDGKNSGGIATNPTTAPSPDPTTSSNSKPTSIPASPTSTRATTSNPASTPENENGEKPAASGFEHIISAVMLIAAVYLIRKRGGR
jgi:hypothetical protein